MRVQTSSVLSLRVVSDKIDLGMDANASAWVEITTAENEEIETQQKEAVDNGI